MPGHPKLVRHGVPFVSIGPKKADRHTTHCSVSGWQVLKRGGEHSDSTQEQLGAGPGEGGGRVSRYIGRRAPAEVRSFDVT